MESSRVFVSGLPPTFTNDQLKKHFATRFHVTDAHVLPKRKIGFVGFKDPEMAKQAAGYFNKTYVKMSKISVEIARPIDSKPDAKKDVGSSAADASTDGTNLKRKREEDQAKHDSRLQEYLSVMQHPSKTKTWANDDIPRPAEEHVPAPEQPEMEPSQDVAASQRKKAKVDGPAQVSHAPKEQEKAQPEPMVIDQSGNEENAENEQDASEKQAEPVSDSDWLRSKTSRLLGLLDEDEQAEFDTKPEEPAASPVKARVEQKPAPVEESEPEDTEMAETEEQVEEHDPNVEHVRNSARLFVRNLPYDTTETDLEPTFSPFGKVDEIHVAFDTRHSTSKGFAYIQYFDPDAAVEAYKNLDRTIFQGRLLHVLPAAAKKTYEIDEMELSKLPVKRQKQIKRKMEASSASFSWNSLYMNADAVMSSVAERLGVSKSDLLDPTSSDAAVKQAHAETHVIQETKAYFTANGVNIEAFKRRDRGNTGILVKNFSYGIKTEELRKLFEPYGQLVRLLMPPSGTIAVVEFAKPDEAQKAFKGLAYRRLGESILFLEKAPKDLFEGPPSSQLPAVEPKGVSQGFSTADTFAADEPEESLPTSTLFVKNLNFATANDKFVEMFRPLDGFVSAKLKTKPDPKRPGQKLSMGFGFVDFRSKEQAQAALSAMNGYTLDQHQLVIRLSHKGVDAAEERRREDTAKKVAARRTKIIIKNLPFQASKKDVRSLFGAYGQLRSVRVPQKFDRSARGFGFADFVSAREAENAMDALKNTHLLGRRLVLEFANEEAIDAEEEIQQIEKKVGEQLDRVKLQKLTGTGRKKFTVGAQDHEET
ncbi:RNA-binding ribosome biosynthesis protein MRD1 [Aspergillus glaucus CBS 516.65]|uniref:Multiple RNA-binding domain-containing protein 1 n=1 Tax=Aspergillus glaucus CBS 516.65 TaxID=1160497 RepID=A0A1L9VRN1_ASPGL|nr:hypothetical protein ASPGLDRAFT_33465 [Aspergillus glaucus CBS 516.65]OJJ86562.1 hypothetical protein ASPGLDRAFT_33465 [Aspergillus glaucus CBS 516.65]